MQTITSLALASIIQTHNPEQYCILDTRSYEEYESGHIPGALHVPYKNLHLELATIKSFSHIYVYGTNDEDTARACNTLATLGVYNVVHLVGGYEQWVQKVGHIETAKESISPKQQMYVALGSIGLLCIGCGILVSAYFFYLTGVLFIILIGISTAKTDFLEYMRAKVFSPQKTPFYQKTEWNFANNAITVKAFYNVYTNALSYAILSDHEILLVDPQRNIDDYLAFAKKHDADIKGAIFTHIHEDFLMGHTELATRTNAKLYAPKNFPVTRSYAPLEAKETIFIGEARVVLSSISFDHKQKQQGKEKESMTNFCARILQDQGGNTLASFIGDMLDIKYSPYMLSYVQQSHQKKEASDIFGNSMLLEKKVKSNKEKQNKTVREYLCRLFFDESISTESPAKKKQVYLFPTHHVDASLLSEENRGIGIAVSDLLKAKTSILHLTPTVALPLLEKNILPSPCARKTIQEYNTQPLPPLTLAQKSIPYIYIFQPLQQTPYVVIDTRSFYERSKYLIAPAINIPLGPKFFSYLSFLHDPKDPQYYIVENKSHALQLINQLTLGGYEKTVKAILLLDEQARHNYTFFGEVTREILSESVIVDVRFQEESKKIPIFDNAVQCPLEQLREKVNTLPQDKVLYVYATDQHVATIAYSIIKRHNPLRRVFIADEEVVSKFKNLQL